MTVTHFSKELTEAIREYSLYLRTDKLEAQIEDLFDRDVDPYLVLLFSPVLMEENPDYLAMLGEHYFKGEHLRADEKKALSFLHTAEGRGSVRALYHMAWHHYDKDEFMQAAEYFKKCISSPVPLPDYMISQCYGCLGSCYAQAATPQKDLAIEYATIAAEKYKSSFAYGLLGILYHEEGPYHDPTKSIHYYKLAADSGNTYAADVLGRAYLYGDENLDIEINYKMAEEILLPFADYEDSSLLYLLGGLYLFKDDNNHTRACSFFERSFALNQDPLTAAFLGFALYCCARYEEAEKMLLLADAAGCTHQSSILGSIYLQGKLGHTDIDKALQYYGRWYDGDNHRDASSCGEYAKLLEQAGHSKKAYEVAAYAVKAFGEYPLYNIMARLVLTGKVTDRMSVEDAVSYMEDRLKYYTVPEDHLFIAAYYLKTRNYRMAEGHYLDAFSAGIADAGVLLGRLYEKGGGSIPPDVNKAFSWYNRAAEAGSQLGRAEASCFEKKKEGLFGNRYVLIRTRYLSNGR